MKLRDVIMGTAALASFGAFLSVIVWKVLIFKPPSVALPRRVPENQAWWQAAQGALRPFFSWFNDYALIIILIIVLGMAAIDFFQTFRKTDSE